MKKQISNIEQGISNIEVRETSAFDVPCSLFCGSEYADPYPAKIKTGFSLARKAG